MVLRDGGAKLLESEEGRWLYHINMTLENFWETVSEGAQSFFLGSRLNCSC